MTEPEPSQFTLGPRQRDPAIDREQTLTRPEIRQIRIDAYQAWITSLRASLSPEEVDSIITRTLVAKDSILDHYYRVAKTDKLTALPNRSAFQERMNELIVSGHPFGILLLDLDHFRDINTRFGHPGGDNVLVQAAMRLVTRIRQGSIERPDAIIQSRRFPDINPDLIARVGGEEFAILLEGIDNEVVLESAAEDLRASIGEQPFVVRSNGQDHQVQITTSLGGAVYRGGDARALFEKIDKIALYGAKEAGRDQSIILPATQS